MKPSNPWLTAARYYPDLFVCLEADDHAELSPGAAILHRIAPFIGKGIMLVCAVYAAYISVIG